MDPPIFNGTPDPEPEAGLFSRLTFSWTLPLLRDGFRRRLERDDLYKIPHHISTDAATQRLQRAWDGEEEKKKEGKTPSFRKALAKAFWWDYFSTTPLVFIEDVVCTSQPIIFHYLMGYFAEPKEISKLQAYALATCLVITNILLAVVGPQIVFRFVKCGMAWQSATCGLVYRKLMKLSPSAKANVKSGHIIDLVSTDAEKLDWLLWFLNAPWQVPLRLVLVTTLVYQVMGPSVFAAIGFFLIVIPIQTLICKRVTYYKKQQMGKQDERVDVITELVGAMRVVKMYCWETLFAKKVDTKRQEEMNCIWRGRIWGALFTELVVMSCRISVALMVLIHVAWHKGALAAAALFPAYDLLSQLAYMLTDMVPYAIKTWMDVAISFDRLQKFLVLDEVEEMHSKSEGLSESVALKNVTASWSVDSFANWSRQFKTGLQKENSPRPALDSVSLEVNSGELLIIHGEVGSGKSSILRALMLELPVTSGEVKCSESVAYVPQTPWVFSGTLRQNVLFGLPFEEARYQKVLSSVALDQDVLDLPYGDSTLVGERGVTLSGGQKARVCLARALYSKAQVYLLDDPLSAVDTRVGNHIMQNAIKSFLKDKAVVLVTHQLQYLREADHVILMNQGKIEKEGKYQEFKQWYSEIHPHDEETVTSKSIFARSMSENHKTKEEYEKEIEDQAEELREFGEVQWKVYWGYFRSGGACVLLVLMLVLFLLVQIISSFADWWLAVWTASEESRNYEDSTNTHVNTSSPSPSTPPTSDLTSTQYAYIYALLVIIMLLFGIIRSLFFNYLTVQASKHIHSKVFQRMVRAPIRFFDTTPKGRIINRFSGDMYAVDNEVPEMTYFLFTRMLEIFARLILIIVVHPLLALAVLPCLILLWLIRSVYVKACRHTARLGKTATSPFLGHLSSSVDGVEVIRAFGAQERCDTDFGLHQDTSIGSWYTGTATFVWFQFWCNATGSLLNILIIHICLLGADDISEATIGLIFCLAIPMISWFQDSVKITAEIEITMTNTERVLEYASLDQEKSADTASDKQPPESWPNKGAIQFDRVSFSYRDDGVNVLQDLSFYVSGSEKVGIVGRTGAGKSSLVQSLLRMAEPEGDIHVDGIDMRQLGLRDVRTSVVVIPQDPVLFSGTIRSNLDPQSAYDDASLWHSLEQMSMKDATCALNGQLDATVTDGGSNFSAGERQLLCLARALLCHRKVLVLDEATANVDKKTDEIIQKTIRTRFADCTVLTIAHRLNTVMDCDKIMVLEKGQLVEYDEPYTLLQHRGKLHGMIQHTGEQEAKRLTHIALESHKKKSKLKTS